MFSIEVKKQYLAMEIISVMLFWCVCAHFKHRIFYLPYHFQIGQTDILISNDITIKINTTLVKVIINHWVVMGVEGGSFFTAWLCFFKK